VEGGRGQGKKAERQCTRISGENGKVLGPKEKIKDTGQGWQKKRCQKRAIDDQRAFIRPGKKGGAKGRGIPR